VKLRNKGEHRRLVLTAGGAIEFKRRYFWEAGQSGIYPADAAAGIEGGSVSPGACEILCRMGIVEDFAQAAEDATRIGNVPVSKERLRQLVEAEAARIEQARNRGALPAAWTAEAAVVAGSPGHTRVYAGIDGVMAPMVTQVEKTKRRQQHAVRRQQRSACKLGNANPLAPARPGHDERYKEMKIGVFYDQPKAHRHVFATAQTCAGYGPLLAAHAKQVELENASESITLTDGAKWIFASICAALGQVTATLLDFYHLSQHVYAAAKAGLGETPEATAWARARLEEFKTIGAAAVLAEIASLDRKIRAPAKQKALRTLREYVVKRLEMLDYATALARQWDIGSGPTEAMCKNLTLRLKRPGMKWDADHASAMMNLIALYESGQVRQWWPARAA
jgi:ribosome-associated translation inhibitor RaiA